MQSEKKSKSNTRCKNVKRGAYIKYHLEINGYKPVDIAEDLGISPASVTRSIYDLATVSRVDKWINNHLGIRF